MKRKVRAPLRIGFMVGLLASPLGIPLSASASHTQWLCTFEADRSEFRFTSSPGRLDDSVAIQATGGCVAGAGSHGGIGDFGGQRYPATMSGFQGGDHILGSCDQDEYPSEFEDFTVYIRNLVVRIQPPGRTGLSFAYSVIWRDNVPFPGPLPHLGRLFDQPYFLEGDIWLETRIGNNCPPDGKFAARYVLHFMQFGLF